MNVLVADDEYYARKAIVKMLGDLDLDITVLGDVETGKEAAAYIETHKNVDLVITDIRMPEMDGLQLAEMIFKNRQNIAVILTTGYADFSYAKQAIRYQVKDYITKPINRDELKNAVVKVLKEKQAMQGVIKRNVEKELLERSSEYLSLKELLRNRQLRAQFMSRTEERAQRFYYRVFILQTDYDFSENERSLLRNRMIPKLLGIQTETFYFKQNDEYVGIIFGGKESLEDADLLEELRAKLQIIRYQYHACSVTMGISKVHIGIDCLYDAYKEAVYIINQRLLQGWNRVYAYEILKHHSLMMDDQAESELYSVLEKGDAATAKQLIRKIFEREEFLQDGDIYSLYDLVINILMVISKVYRSLNHINQSSEDKMSFMFSRRYDLYNFKNICELEEYFSAIIDELCAVSGNQKETFKNSDMIKEMLEYIDRSYQHEISLNQLAVSKYFVNPSYLSRLFKLRVGKSFSKYVMEVRLKKAVELLENSVLKINDIAAAVGYNDTSNFIQIFKRNYGVTPEEYRKAKVF